MLYACTWNDAHGSSSMVAEHEIEHRPYVFTTVGYFLRSDDVGVSMAFERAEDGLYRGHTFIPRVMVIEEWSLGELKRKRAKRTAARPETPPTGNIVTDTQ